MDKTKISDVTKGISVKIAAKGGLSVGIVTEILSKIDNEKGIKVKLDNNETGRIIEIIPIENIEEAKTSVIPKKKKKKGANNKEEVTIVDLREQPEEIDNQSSIFMEHKDFEVTTKFFKPVYCKSIKRLLCGIVIFRVKAAELNVSIFKINLYLRKYCIDKDLKYRVVRAESR